jgi:hypothetical protein
MFYDLCINYENPNSLNLELYQDISELITSAICGKKYSYINIFKQFKFIFR